MRRVALAGLLATQCVLLADQSPTGDQFSTHCALVDESSACGSCMAAQCADELTSCCGDEACRPALSAIDTCADAGTCLFDMSGAAGAVGQCIQSKCGACKALDAGPPLASGKVECTVGDHDCSCDNSFGTNGTTCDVTTHRNSVCCADIGWPTDQYTMCECDEISCTNLGGSCDCMPSSAPTEVPACNRATWGTCCLMQDFCTCGESCTSTQTPVSDCTQASLYQCPSGKTAVASCSQ